MAIWMATLAPKAGKETAMKPYIPMPGWKLLKRAKTATLGALPGIDVELQLYRLVPNFSDREYNAELESYFTPFIAKSDTTCTERAMSEINRVLCDLAVKIDDADQAAFYVWYLPGTKAPDQVEGSNGKCVYSHYCSLQYVNAMRASWCLLAGLDAGMSLEDKLKARNEGIMAMQLAIKLDLTTWSDCAQILANDPLAGYVKRGSARHPRSQNNHPSKKV